MLAVDKASIHLVDQKLEDQVYFHCYAERDAMALPAILQVLPLADARWDSLPQLAGLLASVLDNYHIDYGISSRPQPSDGRIIMPAISLYLHDRHIEIHTGGGGLVPQFSFEEYLRLEQPGWDSRPAR